MFCKETQVTETQGTGISLDPSCRKMSLSVFTANAGPDMPGCSFTHLRAVQQHSNASSLSARPASFAKCVPTGWRETQ
ncbi:hypothetical protein I79_022179 [Cricetulus griseus]|uniref:Uncharacterized protein n=1 Tax=Cricetulus griseus TaxID=10029 RepID=G3IEM8_CRIGR|nr:hypothetical protein I79_022179 [Cricetulus griseus]